MRDANEHDPGPLAWVSDEIHRALEQALAALAEAEASSEPRARLQFAQTHLHQAGGALSIVGLTAVSAVAGELDRLLGELARGSLETTPQRLATARRALAVIDNHIEEIAAGKPDDPRRLLVHYEAIEAARGERLDPLALFQPDLAQRHAPRTTPAPDENELAQGLRSARAGFERGLLQSLRAPDGREGAQLMRDAATELARALPHAAPANLWHAAEGFLDLVAHGEAPGDPRPLATALAKNLRQLSAGQAGATERLTRELLFEIVRCDTRTPTAERIHGAFCLARVWPDGAFEPHAEHPLRPLRETLRKRLATLNQDWDRFCGGEAAALLPFHDGIDSLVRDAAALANPSLSRLLTDIADTARWLREDPLRFNDTVATETATALLLVVPALRPVLDADALAAQVADTCERLASVREGRHLPSGNDSPAIEATRRQQEDEARRQVAREMRSGLGTIEQTLDDYFREPQRHAPLTGLATPLHQIEGAFRLFGHEEVSSLVRESADTIATLAEGHSAPDAASLDRLAGQLSELGAAIDALEHGRSLPLGTELPASANLAAATTPPDIPAAPPAAEPETPPEPAAIDQGIDDELLAIFIEEAHEVLGNIANRRNALEHDTEALIDIRRGVHTLKGSGRMVGLEQLGEVAWAIEQTLNRWLQLELPASDRLRALIDRTHTEFSDWVARIEGGQGLEHDAGQLIAEAEALRSEESGSRASVDEELPLEDDSLPADEEPLLAAIETGTPTEFDLEAFSLADDENDTRSAQTQAQAADPAEAASFDFGDLALPPDPAPSTELTPQPTSAAESDADELAAEEQQPHAAPALSAPLRLGGAEISRPLFALYLSEARGHLEQLRTESRTLHTPAGRPSENALRAAHTLAGISGTTRLPPVQELARALEYGLERLQQHPDEHGDAGSVYDTTVATLEAMLAELSHERLPLAAPELIDALDHLGREPQAKTSASDSEALPATLSTSDVPGAVDAPAPVQDDIDAQLLPIFLEEARELLAELHATLREWQAGNPGNHTQAAARALHTLKGSARMTGAMTLGEHIHTLESRLESGAAHGEAAATLIEELIGGLDHAESTLAELSGHGSVDAGSTASVRVEVEADANEGSETGTSGASLRIPGEALGKLINVAGEVGIARTRIEGELRTVRRSLLDLTENVIRLRNQLREIELQAETQMQSRIAQADSAHAEFDPLEMDRYTRLQELTRMMAESVGDVTTVQQNLLRNLDGAELALHGQGRLSRDLQQSLMQVRMVPFDSLADRLHRVVRQTAKELQRRANLDIRGGRIEIDRGVLERMTAALEHLLRNAVAHGIENADTRRAQGKDPLGQITLSLEQLGNEIVLELADDGRGLDLDAIAERAREHGLLGADEEADAQRLATFIFSAGISTAEEVSAVAGRGIGMDVVKADVTALGGRVELDTRSGQGTRFRIFLPLTLAVTQALLVRAAGATYAIPSNLIAQVLELRSEALHRIQAEGEVEWQSRRFAYHYLPRLLGNGRARPETGRFSWILLLHAGERTLALHVDALRGNEEIVVKDAGPQLVRIVGYSGATLLGNGEIVLILNPIALAGRPPILVDNEHTENEGSAAGEEDGAHQTTVMIVDDSLTVRKITGRLLEREGYRVLTAKDGTDALEQLQEAHPDIVLSDIEMPRMDGFDLLRNLRADSRTEHLPVIMITSRLADKHREHALKLGAREYLGKPYDEDELLRLIERHTSVTAAG